VREVSAKDVRKEIEVPSFLYLVWIASGVCQSSCPPISCGVSDFRGADFGFGVEPNGSGGLPVAGFA